MKTDRLLLTHALTALAAGGIGVFLGVASMRQRFESRGKAEETGRRIDEAIMSAKSRIDQIASEFREKLEQ